MGVLHGAQKRLSGTFPLVLRVTAGADGGFPAHAARHLISPGASMAVDVDPIALL